MLKKLTALSLTALLLLLPFAVTHAEGELEVEPAPEARKDEIVRYNLTEMVFEYGVEGTMAKLKEEGFAPSFVDGMESYLHDLIRRNSGDTKETPPSDATPSNDLSRTMGFCEYERFGYGWWESGWGPLFTTFDYITQTGGGGSIVGRSGGCYHSMCGWIDKAPATYARKYTRFNVHWTALRIINADCQDLN